MESTIRLPSNVVAHAHALIQDTLSPGDVAVDGTVGNGYDTLLLAHAVGPGGRVFGFDVQGAAIEATRSRLDQAGLAAQVTLFQESHSGLDAHLAPLGDRPLAAAMFNFGYLPGSDKAITTSADDSLSALASAADALKPGGLLTAVLYWGHDGGADEADAILAWASGLSSRRYHARHIRSLNRRRPPTLLAIEAIR